METLVVAARIVQFVAGAILFGAPLFFLYALRNSAGSAMRSPRLVLAGCGAAAALGALASLATQTAVMAGDPAAALDGATLADVLTSSAFGASLLTRFAAAIAALVVALTLRAGRPLWRALTIFGGVVLASFPWSGHGAAEDGLAGQVHAAADIVHLLAAGVWLGALAGLALLLYRAGRGTDKAASLALHGALAKFSGIGAGVVALIVASGLINSWFLVGPSRLGQIGASAYGRLLLLKLAMFVAMLGLAALNRYRFIPRLALQLDEHAPERAIGALGYSIILESVLGLAVLLIIGVLGTLDPGSPA